MQRWSLSEASSALWRSVFEFWFSNPIRLVLEYYGAWFWNIFATQHETAQIIVQKCLVRSGARRSLCCNSQVISLSMLLCRLPIREYVAILGFFKGMVALGHASERRLFELWCNLWSHSRMPLRKESANTRPQPHGRTLAACREASCHDLLHLPKEVAGLWNPWLNWDVSESVHVCPKWPRNKTLLELVFLGGRGQNRKFDSPCRTRSPKGKSVVVGPNSQKLTHKGEKSRDCWKARMVVMQECWGCW